MSVEKEFTEDNFIRATNHANRARVAAHVLAPKMRELFPNLFTSSPTVTSIGQQGWSNLTLSVDSGDGAQRYILRLAPCPKGCVSRSTPALEKERYVLERLSGFDFVPRLPQHASGRLTLAVPPAGEVEYGYLLEARLPFEAPRNDCGPRDRLLILRQLGGVAKKIHSIKVSGYGLDFNEALGGFRDASFVDFLNSKAKSIEDSPIDSHMKRWLIARVRDLSHLDPEPSLFHRDLLGNWGNFLVDDSRIVRGIIDWEYAGSGPAFHYEIAALIYVLTRDGHSPEDIEHDLVAVLEGYGMTLEHFKAHYEREVETLVLINSISALQRYEALKQSGDIKREPWRQLFAERASMICTRSYRNR